MIALQVYYGSTYNDGKGTERPGERAVTRYQCSQQESEEALYSAQALVLITGSLQTKYLEKQFNDAQAQIRDIVRHYHPR
jgi:hypothetical protein